MSSVLLLLLFAMPVNGQGGQKGGKGGGGGGGGGEGGGNSKPGSSPAKPPGGKGNLPPSGIKDDYPYGSAPPGLVEITPCLPFQSNLVQAAIGRYYLSNYDYRCDTNNCGVGCCRYSQVQLKCDYDNLYMQQPVSIIAMFV